MDRAHAQAAPHHWRMRKPLRQAEDVFELLMVRLGARARSSSSRSLRGWIARVSTRDAKRALIRCTNVQVHGHMSDPSVTKGPISR